MKANKLFLTVVFVTACIQMLAQPGRWQQRANYTMHIDMDVQTNRFTGKQRIEYFNNSPDKLNRLFYHLYFNAFQPGSSMDVRSRELGKTLFNNRPDWDTRVKDRISKLKDDEIGYQKIKSLKVNGVAQPFKYHETILEVNLKNAILPKSKVIIDLEFEAQIPLQIRRSGRDNPSTGVQYSMSQWYPKLCEYDYEGWHPTPYVAREFYGVWGNFDVKISIDKNYKLGGTGVLVNADEIGWGYDKPGTALKNISAVKRNWHFVGKNIHDFVWAADTAYNHLTKKVNNRVTLHVIYKYKPDNAVYEQGWQQVMVAAEKVLPFIEKHFGQYPYPQYSFIHGGDGGMEYPMATLIHTSSLGTAFHEWMHSWYQMMLGTNESLYPWMDEGFTSYAEDLVTKFYSGKSSLQPLRDSLAKYPGNENYQRLVNTLPEDHTGAYNGYYRLVQSGLEEPLTTHADHYNSNFAYSIASYSKGEMFLEQLGYIVGAAVRNKILLEYYKQWRFKHPNANDFMVIAQQVSGLQMDWYKEYWINTTKTIDYGIGDVSSDSGKTTIVLQRIGEMPMPVDLEVTYKDGSKEIHNIPLNLMFGAKKNENAGEKYFVHEEWRWTHPEYKLTINAGLNFIKKIEIDPSKRMADINHSNNVKEQ
ncbi:MAG: M1 family metallopeptidase [Chitinophagaceae bacterium]|nr:M1 family metallopeptidase [Chitinophagaceae bacterium]